MKNLFLAFLLLNVTLCTGQKKQVWRISDGEQLRAEGKVREAVGAYKNILAFDSTYAEGMCGLAGMYSLLRMPDSAFYYLFRANNIRPSLDALSNPDFYPLHKDLRWSTFESELIALYQKKYDSLNLIPNIDFAKKLFRMCASDQAYYLEYQVIRKQLGEESFLQQSIWDLKKSINEQNLKELEQLIAEEGWPKLSEVGPANKAAFLVIQHAGLEQQKKYLPMLRAACEQHEDSWRSYALMYDRIQVGEHKPQKYGSQVFYNQDKKKWELSPLENREKVEEYRESVGLGPLKDYLKQWNIEL